jgi:hypothetical protein
MKTKKQPIEVPMPDFALGEAVYIVTRTSDNALNIVQGHVDEIMYDTKHHRWHFRFYNQWVPRVMLFNKMQDALNRLTNVVKNNL